MNPSKQHLLQKKTLYEEGRIETPELLSSEDICASPVLKPTSCRRPAAVASHFCLVWFSDGGTSSVALTGPEESDEQDWLPAQRQ